MARYLSVPEETEKKESQYCSGAAKDKRCPLQATGSQKHGAERRLQQSWETNQGSILCCPDISGLLCNCFMVLCPTSTSCTQRGSAGDVTLPVQSSAAAAFLLPCTQPSKHLLCIWWSSEQTWCSSSGRKSWWSDVSQMGCPPALGLPTSLTSASRLVILNHRMICTTLGTLVSSELAFYFREILLLQQVFFLLLPVILSSKTGIGNLAITWLEGERGLQMEGLKL